MTAAGPVKRRWRCTPWLAGRWPSLFRIAFLPGNALHPRAYREALGVDAKHPRAWVHPHRSTPERISEQADRFRPIRTTGNGKWRRRRGKTERGTDEGDRRTETARTAAPLPSTAAGRGAAVFISSPTAARFPGSSISKPSWFRERGEGLVVQRHTRWVTTVATISSSTWRMRSRCAGSSSGIGARGSPRPPTVGCSTACASSAAFSWVAPAADDAWRSWPATSWSRDRT